MESGSLNYKFRCIEARGYGPQDEKEERPSSRHEDVPNFKYFSHKSKEIQMAKQTAEHHTRAAEHSGHAQKHHQQAAKQHEAGNHEKAAHHAQVAQGHQIQATHHANEAAKSHTEHHGNKE